MAITPTPDQMRVIEAAIAAGDGRRAALLADTLVEQGRENASLLVLAAHHALAQGAAEAARARAGRALALAPESVEALQVLGQSLALLGRHGEAVAAYDSAIAIAPAVPALHLNRGMALDNMGELARARAAYEQAVALRPGLAPAHARLAYIAARQGDTKAARAHAMRALAGDGRDTVASFALASAELDDGNLDAAEKLLVPLLASHPAMAWGMMGDVLHGRGRYGQAFEAYEKSGRAFAEMYARDFAAPGTLSALAWVRGRIAHFAEQQQALSRPEDDDEPSAPPADGAPADDSAPAPHPAAVAQTHVFLVGFPRSGTTLLESVLGAHPDIAVMDERDCLYRAVAPLGKGPEALDRFAALDERGLDPIRAAYWEGVRAEGGLGPGRRAVFIDKMPLNLVQLCFVKRLFPGAKILFALRDPRDVVLSGFRRRFGMTLQMYELNTLEGAARYYDAVMTLAMLYRGALDLDVCEVRHEDLLADFARESRRVCDFLGVEWVPGMDAFAPAAAARASNTPSAAQLARGLAPEAASEWRNYRMQMAPVLRGLAPWVARFGYPES
jgi:tetratricopeptide (TPR) repeat protein